MFGSEMLDVAVGMIFIYLLVSVVCSAVREGIEALTKTRAAYLEYGIRELLHDVKAEGIANSLYDHPLIKGLFPGEYKPGGESKPRFFTSGAKLPSYIPAENFAIALMDIAARGPKTDAVSGAPTSTEISLDAIRANIRNIGNPAVQRVLLTALDSAQGDLNKARAHIAAWFDSGMDRISGWYKRLTQWILFSIGLAVAIAFNIDTFAIANHLYKNEEARSVIVEQAKVISTGSIPNIKPEDALEKLKSKGLPIGWPMQESQKREGWPAWIPARVSTGIALIFGWLITALAVSMGAPFWFDMLNKVMVIRSTVKPHEKSPEEASEDHQTSVTPQPGTSPGGGAPGAPAQPVTQPASPVPPDNLPGLTDPESLEDGCDFEINKLPGEELTTDEDLPPAEGGIEK